MKTEGKYPNVTERMICAGYDKKDGRDSCGGDSGQNNMAYSAYIHENQRYNKFCFHELGGPLVSLTETGNLQLIGVVSWGEYLDCTTTDLPGVYTSVAYLRSWITEKSGI